MSTVIQRRGQWFHRHSDGTWVRWNAAARSWIDQPGGPPPPLPPPPAPDYPQLVASGPPPDPPRASARRYPWAAALATIALLGVVLVVVATVVLDTEDLAAPVADEAGVMPQTDPTAERSPASVVTAKTPTPVTAEPVETPLTRERTAFAAQAEALCARATAAQQGVVRPTTLPEMGTYARQTILITETLTERLRRLKPPAGAATEIDIMLREIDHAIVFLRELAAAAERADYAAVERAAAGAQSHLETADEIARRHGLTECSTAAS